MKLETQAVVRRAVPRRKRPQQWGEAVFTNRASVTVFVHMSCDLVTSESMHAEFLCPMEYVYQVWC